MVRERLAIYKSETLPILDYYKAQDKTVIVDFETKRGKADYPQVKGILSEGFDELALTSSDEEEELVRLVKKEGASIQNKVATAN